MVTGNNDAAKAANATGTPELSTLTVGKGLTGKDEEAADQKPGKEKPEPPAKKLSLQDRLKKFEELSLLLERRGTIQEALDNVNGFHISKTGTCHLKFTDSNGKSFGIAHPIVIGEMVHMAKEKLRAELAEIENLFVF